MDTAAAEASVVLPAGRRLVRLSLIVFAGYVAVGAVSLSLGQYTGLASPVWPAAGLAFAAAYVWGWRLLPVVALGSLASNLVTLARQDTLTDQALVVAAAIALGAALQALVGAALVSRFVGRRAGLTHGGQIVAFLLLAGPAACLVNGTVATSAQLASGLLSTDQAVVLWATWWAGDAIGVVVFAPLVLMMMPEQRSIWEGRRWRVAIPSVVGVTLFVALFMQSQFQAEQARSMRMEQLANAAAGELERNVARHQEVLEGLASYFQSSQRVDADEFASYTRSALARFPNLQALSWNPSLTYDQIPAFEQQQRSMQGLAGYTVRERDTAGDLVPVRPRDGYVVVGLIEPLDANKEALGFDINSNPTRREAIQRARDLGVPSGTDPIDLVQESGTQQGMLALLPVYAGGVVPADVEARRERLLGFAVGVYRLGDLLTDTFTASDWADAQIRLVDVTSADDPKEVAVRQAVSPASVDLTSGAAPAASSQDFTVYGRRWLVEVTVTSGPLANVNEAQAPLIELVGLVFLTLLQAFVLLVTGLERQAVRRAEHADREANTDPLTGLHNRRSFLRNLELVRERSESDESTDVLLFIDLDRFKAVNDVGGHEAGDLMLQRVARALRSAVRSRDTVARIGGDEFAVILNNCGIERGLAIAEGIVERVTAVGVDGGGSRLSVGISIGATTIEPRDGLAVDELIRRADDACYAAKHSGGGVLGFGDNRVPKA